MKITITLFRCPYCKHIWVSKKLSPTGCPKCHNKLIKEPKILKRYVIDHE